MQNFNLEQYYNEIEAIDADMLELKRRKNDLEYEVAKYFESDFNEKLSAKPDKCGTVTIKLDDFDVKYNVSKRVDWDQEKLDQIYSRIIQHEDPKKYMKVEYDISETAFKTWPQAIQETFMPARALKPGGGKLTIVRKGD